VTHCLGVFFSPLFFFGTTSRSSEQRQRRHLASTFAFQLFLAIVPRLEQLIPLIPALDSLSGVVLFFLFKTLPFPGGLVFIHCA
jgi:hypothetical protein